MIEDGVCSPTYITACVLGLACPTKTVYISVALKRKKENISQEVLCLTPTQVDAFAAAYLHHLWEWYYGRFLFTLFLPINEPHHAKVYEEISKNVKTSEGTSASMPNLVSFPSPDLTSFPSLQLNSLSASERPQEASTAAHDSISTGVEGGWDAVSTISSYNRTSEGGGRGVNDTSSISPVSAVVPAKKVKDKRKWEQIKQLKAERKQKLVPLASLSESSASSLRGFVFNSIIRALPSGYILSPKNLEASNPIIKSLSVFPAPVLLKQ